MFVSYISHHFGTLEHHKVRHPRCVYNKLDWSVYTCLKQLYDVRDMYNLSRKEQLHVSALLPPNCMQPTKVECSCLLSFFIYQPEDGQ